MTTLQNDPDKIELEFPCIRARQPIGDIFIASIPYRRLLSITYFDVRKVIHDEHDFERYLGIQRVLDGPRVEKLKRYVNFADATFPTSIILAIDDERYVRFSEDRGRIILSNFLEGEEVPSTALAKLARVLDGQHRIAGLANFKGHDFELSVSVFIGADVSDQAQIFATVNLEQTKVNKSLVYDLYELSRSRSPEKTCHNVAVALDRDSDSPLFRRIKRLGIATEGRKFEPVTQATFVEGLLPYISADPKGDRDAILKGRSIAPARGDETFKMPFRNLFVVEKDIDIVQIVYNYFSAISIRWPLAWNTRDQGFILNRTNGVRALLRNLRRSYLKVANPGDVPTREQFLDVVFRAVPLSDGEINTDNFLPGSSGEARLVSILDGRERPSDLVRWVDPTVEERAN